MHAVLCFMDVSCNCRKIADTHTITCVHFTSQTHLVGGAPPPQPPPPLLKVHLPPTTCDFFFRICTFFKAHLPPTTCELFFINCTFSEKGDGDGGDGDGRRIFRRPPPPYPIAPRDEISRSGIPLTSIIYIGFVICWSSGALVLK